MIPNLRTKSLFRLLHSSSSISDQPIVLGMSCQLLLSTVSTYVIGTLLILKASYADVSLTKWLSHTICLNSITFSHDLNRIEEAFLSQQSGLSFTFVPCFLSETSSTTRNLDHIDKTLALIHLHMSNKLETCWESCMHFSWHNLSSKNSCQERLSGDCTGVTQGEGRSLEWWPYRIIES